MASESAPPLSGVTAVSDSEFVDTIAETVVSETVAWRTRHWRPGRHPGVRLCLAFTGAISDAEYRLLCSIPGLVDAEVTPAAEAGGTGTLAYTVRFNSEAELRAAELWRVHNAMAHADRAIDSDDDAAAVAGAAGASVGSALAATKGDPASTGSDKRESS